MAAVPMVYPPAAAQPAERRKIFADVDHALWSWFHVRVCAVAGVGFFTDAYDLFAINIASFMLRIVYGISPLQDFGIKASRYACSTLINHPSFSHLSADGQIYICICICGSVGSLFGQLLFGWLADVLGRKRIYGVELCLMILGSLGQAVSGQGRAVSIVGTLMMWRFIMGVGVGGDYPSSAVISSEFAPTRTRGRIMTSVFATQGLGNLAASIVSLVVLAAFKSGIETEEQQIDYCWRLLIGLGCVPGVIALYFRLTISETPRFTIDVLHNVQQAMIDVNDFLNNDTDYVVQSDAPIQRAQPPDASQRDFIDYFSKPRNLKILLGAAYSWFALDVAFYGLGLNSSVVIDAIFNDFIRSDPYPSLLQVSIGNIILSIAGLMPGYVLALLFIDSWGRKPMQLMGFIASSVTFFIMGFVYHYLFVGRASPQLGAKVGFAVLYCIAELFQNFGPNTTTFVVPGEAFPTRYRSTAYGICAAAGKTGAILAQVIFYELKDTRSRSDGGNGDDIASYKVDIFLWVLCGVMLTGVVSTLLLPETMGKSLEENAGESNELIDRRDVDESTPSLQGLRA